MPSWSKRFRGGGGVYPECVPAETENAIGDAHPELTAREVFEVVAEWLRAVDEPVH